ncbi:helix-turn-helix domain-containing protein [Metabacillus halosaccharovorans]|uniref:helix-turn-helix domain-containing protein n=1 Tax=Metabacillus halosaccharovorans TaxID=930124 RepID=UPI0011169640|nr:helix-turn-helix domain-containing protein [Metabacillus halosaccharovorans]
MENQRTYKHWTFNELKVLIELKEKGLKYREIAKKLDRSPLSVEKRYRKLMSS